MAYGKLVRNDREWLTAVARAQREDDGDAEWIVRRAWPGRAYEVQPKPMFVTTHRDKIVIWIAWAMLMLYSVGALGVVVLATAGLALVFLAIFAVLYAVGRARR